MRKSNSLLGSFLEPFGARQSRKPKRRETYPTRVLWCEELESRRMLSVYYVDATDGDDSWTGLAGAYTSGTTGPWQTIQKVNSETQSAGDSVLFKCGEVWRETLVPDSGSAVGDVTYGAYGEGDKPLLMSSKEINSGWTNVSGNIWTTPTGTATVTGSELLENNSFDDEIDDEWGVQVTGTSVTAYRDDVVYDTSDYGYSIDRDNDTEGTIQFYTSVPITTGEYYKLTFRARSTDAFDLNSITLDDSYDGITWATDNQHSDLAITTSWTTYTVVYEAYVSGTAWLIFNLNDLPNGETFSIDTLSFKQCNISADFLPHDVGNIIFDEGDTCGVKEWEQGDLDAQGEYYYDPTDYTVKLYSTSNPGSYYSDIELALGRMNVFATSRAWITIENLALMNTGLVGISTGYNHDFTVRGCDIGFSGGSKWVPGKNARLGGAFEIYGSAYNMLVEDCKILDSYDAGVTNQTKGAATQHDIIYRNNIIWNCEYSYEYFQRDDSVAYDIYFENNTCAYAGGSWAHDQRPDPNGTHMKLGNQTAELDDFYIRNNIFYESTERGGIWIYSPWTDLDNLTLDNNLYYESSGYAAAWFGNYYTLEDFDDYVSLSGKDVNSMAAQPKFVDPENLDFHLLYNSPAINAGADTDIDYDYNGIARPQGEIDDIGAYEYQYLPVMTGLQSQWRLDETSAGAVADSYGTNDGTNSGADINQTGQINTAYNFVPGDSVAIPSMNYDQLTVSAWFCRDTKDASYADAIFGGWRYSGTTQLNEGYDLTFLTNSDTLSFVLTTETSGGTKTLANAYYDLGDSVGEWFYVAGTYDQTTGVQTLYVNGVAVSYAYHTAGNTVVPLTYYDDMRIGYSRVQRGYFDGRIDDVRVYSRPLTAAEVSRNYSWGGTFAMNMKAAGGEMIDSTAPMLNQTDLQPVVDAAIARWSVAGLDASTIATLAQVQFAISDLPGDRLGLADTGQVNIINIDCNAAGYGWFVDPTPMKDEEYARPRGNSQLLAVDPWALDRIDLLTVVEHELGHIAGFDDLSVVNHLMSDQLDVGIRHLPRTCGHDNRDLSNGRDFSLFGSHRTAKRQRFYASFDELEAAIWMMMQDDTDNDSHEEIFASIGLMENAVFLS